MDFRETFNSVQIATDTKSHFISNGFGFFLLFRSFIRRFYAFLREHCGNYIFFFDKMQHSNAGGSREPEPFFCCPSNQNRWQQHLVERWKHLPFLFSLSAGFIWIGWCIWKEIEITENRIIKIGNQNCGRMSRLEIFYIDIPEPNAPVCPVQNMIYSECAYLFGIFFGQSCVCLILINWFVVCPESIRCRI